MASKPEIDEAERTLETKLKHIAITRGKTEKILDSNNQQRIERHREALTQLVSEADLCKRTVEGLKISKGDDIESIGEWAEKMENTIGQADIDIEKTQRWIAEANENVRAKSRREQLDFEKELYETKLHYKNQLANDQQGEETLSHSSVQPSGVEAKLPKLVITKFNGTYQDWPRFWNQFRETIDKSSVSSVTKFSYLRELLDRKVKPEVEALPFTSEGYNRAKSILESKYGKESEIVKAYTKQILDLPHIADSDAEKIHDFTDKLTYCVQSLETMGKLKEIKGNVAMTLDKLSGIRSDLVRTDPEWEDWDYIKLTEALKLWTRRNPIDSSTRNDSRKRNRDKVFHTKLTPRGCVYCEAKDHKSIDCTKVVDIKERKQALAKHRLCFNCTGDGHHAASCASKLSCQHCQRRHHTSICDQQKEKKKLLTTTKNGEGIFPIVIVKVNGVTCRALVDSGAGSSYASARLINLLKSTPVDVKMTEVNMLMSTKLERLETHQAVIEPIDGEFKMPVRLTKVNKSELLSVDNPEYQQLVETYPHLKGVKVNDTDQKAQLPVHVVLGGGEYARIKTDNCPRVGKEGEPIAELTKLGWFVMSPGKEFDRHYMLLTQTTQHDYEDLCRMDVLGLADTAEHDQESVYEEFKEQLVRSPEGWYETGLPWRGNHPPLPSNKEGSLRRLERLVKKLDRQGITTEYNQIIEEQKRTGIIELAPDPPTGQEFYLPHKPVVRHSAQSTKTRVVYDASAKAQPEAPSLNDCLYPGPSLQNKLWDVLVHHRSFPIALCSDVEKAFLQIRIKLEERDALRFHWKSDEHSDTLVYRFTRVLFGLTSSPFLLGGVIEQHLETWEEKMPDVVAELKRSMYVDDLLNGAQSVELAREKKSKVIEIFDDAKFTLHKWNSNVPELEDAVDNSEDEGTLAKQQLGTKPCESKILGLPWDKDGDLLSVVFPTSETSPTKRGVLSTLAQVYDPMGFACPLTLQGKLLYRDICNEKLAWDVNLNKPLCDRWRFWKESLPPKVEAPRSIVSYREPILSLELHAFGDASTKGVGTAVYSVARQPSGITQRLVAAKSRLAKQGLTVPRLELISAHMATNLLINVRNALGHLPTPQLYAWLDSTVALHWIQGNGQYKQFVSNRVTKIHQHEEIQWRHVPTSQNPADLASRGGNLTSLWWNGPEWLPDRSEWPEDLVTRATPESEEEAKIIRQVVGMTQDQPKPDAFEKLLEKFSFQRAIRVAAYVSRFLSNCKAGEKKKGTLTVEEIERAKGDWIRRVQRRSQSSPVFQQHRKELNLEENDQGFIECRGRIEGRYPIYLPTDELFTHKLVEKVHLETLHGGVGLTMAAVREKYWIPKLRSLTKRVRKACWGCKRFRATPLDPPPQATLPTDRVCGERAFEVVGVDFAGPIYYKRGSGRQGKAYLVLYSCSLIRAVHLEILPNLETSTFIPCFKRFVARRGRPRKIYSDNGGTFVKAAKWIRTLRKDERLQGYLQNHEIVWQFNLSRAPWWGGQFERLIGVVKQALYKSIGGAKLTFNELSEVILDVEVQINRRPLSYVEDDIQLPVLTPWSFLFQGSILLPETEPWREEDADLRKRAKYLKSCKDSLWRRWSREYLNALRERHNLNHQQKKFIVNVGDIVIIKSDDKNRGNWPLAVVREVYPGRDNVVRGVMVETAKGNLERPIQHLYPLELSCDKSLPTKTNILNPEVEAFRPKRAAAATADEKIKIITEEESRQ